MTRMTAPPDKIGVPARHKPGHWVQTERKAHEAWAGLIARKPRAAMLLHHLVAQMGHQNAVVISQKTLAKLLGVNERTVRRAVADLVEERWIQVVRLGRGKEAAYVVNDRVAWGQPRDQLRLSVFSAAVVADFDDQDEALLGHGDLRRIPTLYPGEQQLPSGPGEEPPSQPAFPGLEPDLPHIDMETGEVLDGDMQTRVALEQRGQQRLPMAEEPCFLDDGEPLEPPTHITRAKK
ncbi:TPA: helix-turn-helix domain-containing protein [Escherichia coli]|nr:helix-turn-helix domain-containing protein [Escherichia coli]HDK2780770.1 helix-turn-helix domain-containing protein [Escherichia coli]